jgi:hypothetical protein
MGKQYLEYMIVVVIVISIVIYSLQIEFIISLVFIVFVKLVGMKKPSSGMVLI